MQLRCTAAARAAAMSAWLRRLRSLARARARCARLAARWDTYLLMGDEQIHWFSIVNSLMIVLFLTGMVRRRTALRRRDAHLPGSTRVARATTDGRHISRAAILCAAARASDDYSAVWRRPRLSCLHTRALSRGGMHVRFWCL